MYEGRTSSMLSASSSANAYATFNPVVSHPFGMDSRFGIGMNSLAEECVCVQWFMSSMDEITALTTTPAVNPVTAEERHYLQLLALAQLGGVLRDGQRVSCEVPAVVINQSGSTETTGRNWLLPVAARDSYEHFYQDAISTECYALSAPSLPARRRL